jgi:DNA adenine methylase
MKMKAGNKLTRRSGQPFLKWTGGKRWIAETISDLVPERRGRYFEPFLGGASVYFYLRPWPATLSDVNEELINLYTQLRDNVSEVMERLRKLKIDASTYQKIRSSEPRAPITRAVRLLYLNRTAFNGIYRVNQEGQFNVPFGCKKGTILCDDQLLKSASNILQNRTIVSSDFEVMIDSATRHDVIYADPPYTTRHNNNGFRRYNESLFTWSDQERLAKSCMRAAARGASVIVSNAAHREIGALYNGFHSKTVSRYTGISGRAHGRGVVSEKIFFKTTV